MNRLLLCLAALPLLAGCQKSKTGFDGEAAYRYAATQVSFGPRVPGSPGWQKAGDWIVAQMRARADTVIEQRWMHTLANGDSIPMRNILARFRPQATDRVLYLTHWDTRPIADSDPNPANRNKPILGANDGASGVGLFVALGDLLKKTPPNVGVDLLFVDGEDYGSFGPPKDVDVLIGSTYFASHLPSPGYQPIFGVLFDMIGDKELDIYEEQNSVARAPEVVSRVWKTADDLGYSQYFLPQMGMAVTDDHIPLLQAGLRVIDVIDIDYESPSNNYHHTLADTMDKISAKSLGIVGDVAAALVTTQQ
ncbi:MAG TPA: M28 family peptidase [Gemmatimonadaceae bacterium]|nr:M28 family peptidase [Gemmatimonadaceae bacterium]